MFYVYTQNNSGGFFIENEDVSVCTIIEALDHNEANEKAQEIGIYFYGCTTGEDCSCCGDRWYELSECDDAYNSPMIYGKSVYDIKKSVFRQECIIHYLDGKIERVQFKD